MNKEQLIHDIAIAYVSYSNLANKTELLTIEQFYQEYLIAADSLKAIVEQN